MKKLLLAVAHPSHELRLHGWLQRNSPHVIIMTNGAGRDNVPRVNASLNTVENLNCIKSPFWGIVSDLEVYDAVLKADFKFFSKITDEIRDYLIAEKFDLIIGDAAEGFSVTHDVFRDILTTAITEAEIKLNSAIANYEFTLYKQPSFCPTGLENTVIEITLDDSEFDKKVESVMSYSDKLAFEVDLLLKGGLLKSINRFSEPSFAKEAMKEFSSGLGVEEVMASPEISKLIFPFLEGVTLEDFKIEKVFKSKSSIHNFSYDKEVVIPFYQFYGQYLVSKGAYNKPIDFNEHMKPIGDLMEKRRKIACNNG